MHEVWVGFSYDDLLSKICVSDFPFKNNDLPQNKRSIDIFFLGENLRSRKILFDLNFTRERQLSPRRILHKQQLDNLFLGSSGFPKTESHLRLLDVWPLFFSQHSGRRVTVDVVNNMFSVPFSRYFCTSFVVVRVEEWNYVDLSEFCHFDLFGHVFLPVLRMGCGSINDMCAFQGRQDGDSWGDLGGFLVSTKNWEQHMEWNLQNHLWGEPNLSVSTAWSWAKKKMETTLSCVVEALHSTPYMEDVNSEVLSSL